MAQRYVLFCVMALLASSAGASAWMGKGSFEPSTSFDTEGLFNHFTPDTDPNPNVKKVYFNGFTTQGSPAATTAASPNVAAVGSAIQAPYGATYVMLGVWKDCNRDGYIGSGDVQWHYPAFLLPSTSVCPPTPGTYPSYNDGEWVREFTPITWRNDSSGFVACCDPNTYVDNLAKVWMDVGLASDVFPLPACLNAPPRFYTHTGAMLAKVDCETGYAVTTAVNTYGPEAISFEDVPLGRQGESSSALNQKLPTGDDKDASYVSAFDCSGDRFIVDVPHVPGWNDQEIIYDGNAADEVVWNWTDEDGKLVWTELNPALKIPTVNPDGSFWGTVNATQHEPTDCDGSEGNSFSDQGPTLNVTIDQYAQYDNCIGGLLLANYCEASGYSRYIGRTQPNMMLGSEQWPTKYNTTTTGDPTLDIPRTIGSYNAEQSHWMGGLSVRQYWLGGLLPTMTIVNTRDFQPAPVNFYTYYGYVSPAAVVEHGLTLPGGAGSYGSDACALSAIDNVVRFNCDRSNWWTRLDGSEIPAPQGNLNRCMSICDPRAFLGDPYNLRDVDCYDQAIAAQREAGLGLAAVLTGRGC